MHTVIIIAYYNFYNSKVCKLKQFDCKLNLTNKIR